jgi:hypothetical protein
MSTELSRPTVDNGTDFFFPPNRKIVQDLVYTLSQYGFPCTVAHKTRSSSTALYGDLLYEISPKSVKKCAKEVRNSSTPVIKVSFVDQILTERILAARLVVQPVRVDARCLPQQFFHVQSNPRTTGVCSVTKCSTTYVMKMGHNYTCQASEILSSG